MLHDFVPTSCVSRSRYSTKYQCQINLCWIEQEQSTMALANEFIVVAGRTSFGPETYGLDCSPRVVLRDTYQCATWRQPQIKKIMIRFLTSMHYFVMWHSRLQNCERDLHPCPWKGYYSYLNKSLSSCYWFCHSIIVWWFQGFIYILFIRNVPFELFRICFSRYSRLIMHWRWRFG